MVFLIARDFAQEKSLHVSHDPMHTSSVCCARLMKQALGIFTEDQKVLTEIEIAIITLIVWQAA